MEGLCAIEKHFPSCFYASFFGLIFLILIGESQSLFYIKFALQQLDLFLKFLIFIFTNFS